MVSETKDPILAAEQAQWRRIYLHNRPDSPAAELIREALDEYELRLMGRMTLERCRDEEE